MDKIKLTKDDIKQIESIGLTESRVYDQIKLFKKGTPYLKLVRPCAVGDGIVRLSGEALEKNIAIFEKEAPNMRLTKFVPASGAATRMMKTLIKADNQCDHIRKPDVQSGLLTDKKENQELLTFITNITRFACYPDLKAAMAAHGLEPDSALSKGDFKDFINFLVTDKGLNYGGLPKGLIQFHTYREGSRTAFEEHLVEAAGYAVMKDRTCAIHFTVSEAHEEIFRRLLHAVQSRYESMYQVSFQISFSVQKNNTNTIAVDMDNQPFRTKAGHLLFRPGGHGALIDNLNELNGDIVFIKNIDNVSHDRLKADMFAWKKALAGYLIRLQQQIFSYLKKLHQDPVEIAVIDAAALFIQNELFQSLPKGFHTGNLIQKKEALIERLDRPLRVCGMVPNVGEPGGGPFWVRGNDAEVSMQIVETSQIDLENQEQKAILGALTHFNPVDLVCGIGDWRGNPFDLSRFVDRDAVFISQKSESGRDLKALEHPGLWNGAMAYWNTIFIEVPLITFNPVKQMTDLLREAHLP